MYVPLFFSPPFVDLTGISHEPVQPRRVAFCSLGRAISPSTPNADVHQLKGSLGKDHQGCRCSAGAVAEHVSPECYKHTCGRVTGGMPGLQACARERVRGGRERERYYIRKNRSDKQASYHRAKFPGIRRPLDSPWGDLS